MCENETEYFQIRTEIYTHVSGQHLKTSFMEINDIILNYASWKKRLLNLFVDGLIISFIIAIVFKVIINSDSQDAKNLINHLLVHHDIGIIHWDIDFFSLIIFFLYYLISESIFKTTVGKLITRTQVVRINGNKLRIQDALIRSLLRLIPLEQLTFISSHPVGAHDSLSNTRVINKMPNH